MAEPLTWAQVRVVDSHGWRVLVCPICPWASNDHDDTLGGMRATAEAHIAEAHGARAYIDALPDGPDFGPIRSKLDESLPPGLVYAVNPDHVFWAGHVDRRTS